MGIEMSENLVLVHGRVVSGRGIAHRHLKDDADQEEIKSIIGKRIFPGTLNVLLHAPVQISRSNAYDITSGRRYLCPASISGIPVWIHRWPYKPLHVAELISTVRLRDELNIPDEGNIELLISQNNLDPVPPLSKAIWAACWKYREGLYYTSNTYHKNKHLGRLQRFFNAGQHP